VTTAAPGTLALGCEGVSKRFGTTQAVRDAALTVARGEILGLVGHNGAGKSTMMRTLAGLVQPDRGTIEVGGERFEHGLDPRRARAHGVRIVQQELALCPVLQVGEAGVLQCPGIATGVRWRQAANRRVAQRIQEIFPGTALAPERSVASLSIGLRQVVEIATALLRGPGERIDCVILDEPTSSLDGESALALYDWLKRAAEREGFGVIVSTHKLDEVFRWHDRVSVMTDGEIVAQRRIAETSREDLVALMQRPADARAAASAASAARHAPAEAPAGAAASPPPAPRAGGIALRDARGHGMHGVTLDVGPGEIVGLGGLEGQGQDAVLEAVAAAARRRLRLGRGRGVRVEGRLAVVSGDRVDEGVFALWSVEHNLSASALRGLGRLGFVSARRERSLAERWLAALRVKGAASDRITSLSGGTQQKVLLARALATTSDVLLLKDPTRGVDEATKLEIYALLERQREAGTAILWYSSESRELQRCDRVHVLQAGRVAATLEGSDADEREIEEQIINASFA